MIKISGIANKGSVGMVKRVLRKDSTKPKLHKCHASFLCYSVGQDTTKLGETAYGDETGWNDRSVNWTQLLTTAKGQSGAIEEARMDQILGRNRKTISP